MNFARYDEIARRVEYHDPLENRENSTCASVLDVNGYRWVTRMDLDLAVDATSDDLLSQIECDGFAIMRRVVSANCVSELRDLCSLPDENPAVARRGDSVYGIRHLLSAVPRVHEIVSHPPFLPLVAAVVGQSVKPVMGVFFDKPPGANWPVAWHQDVTIRVRERLEVPGFEPRPVRDGVVHLLPPVELSEQMLTLRIHLDDASSSHGALRVIPGSHRRGRLSNEQLRRESTSKVVTCEVAAGDVMLMRPLLIHASSACEQPAHRRVIQIEYANFELNGGLQWHG